MGALQFLFASIGATIAISITSLLWPRVTNKPSPPALTQVRQVVEQTPIGKEVAQVLSAVNIRDWAVSEGNAILSNIEQSASNVVVSNIVKQLSEAQKIELQQILCSTPSAAKL